MRKYDYWYQLAQAKICVAQSGAGDYHSCHAAMHFCVLLALRSFHPTIQLM